jgi:hypothetical protein
MRNIDRVPGCGREFPYVTDRVLPRYPCIAKIPDLFGLLSLHVGTCSLSPSLLIDFLCPGNEITVSPTSLSLDLRAIHHRFVEEDRVRKSPLSRNVFGISPSRPKR